MSNLNIIARDLLDLGYSNQILGNHFPKKIHFKNKYWNLHVSNNFFKAKDIDQIVKSKIDNSQIKAITTNDFGELVNLTSFNHFLDGFNYFKCFLKSLLNNDFKVSTHLLYYAELRWLHSLLTSQGLINFDRSYIVATNDGYKDLTDKVKSFGSSHNKAWTLFEVWADLPQADELLNKTFLVRGISYKDWLEAGKAPYSSGLLKGWLMGLHDTKLPYQYDKDIRNKFSYRAHEDYSSFEIPALKEGLDFLLIDINQIFSLDENDSFFENLDRDIFFTAIDCQYTNMTRENKAKEIKKFFQDACKVLSIESDYADLLHEKMQTSPSLADKLRKLVDSSDLQTVKFMFYRAILLMRLACSSLKINLQNSGKSHFDIQVWFKTRLNNTPWLKDTIEDSLIDYSCELEDFIVRNEQMLSSPPQTLWELSPDIYSDLLKFTDLDIAAVWSFN